MADVANSKLSISEIVKRKGADGNIITIAEVLEETNQILDDIPWIESNDMWSNKSVRRSYLPSGSWRKFYQGVSPEASGTAELVDVIGQLQARAENDRWVVDSSPNPAETRNQENRAFIAGMGQEMAQTLIYGNALTAPEEFTGLAARMDSIFAAGNVINEGGSGGDTTSIYIVTWGMDTAYGIYPRNSPAGLQHEDLGVIDAFDSSNNRYRAYGDVFTWNAGLCVKHPRAIGRLANIEVSGGVNTFDEDNLITLLNRMVTGPGTRIYCNRDIITQMEIRAKDKTNINYSPADGLAPGITMKFKGFAIRMCDQILNTETAVA